MSKVRTFSRVYPSYHPRKGEPTYFVEKIYNTLFAIGGFVMTYKILCDLNPDLSPDILWPFWISIERSNEDLKGHTIRAGHHLKVGDWFSPRVWSGKPYNSKQIIIAPDIEVKKVWDLGLSVRGDFKEFYSGDCDLIGTSLSKIAKNDGLSIEDLFSWFNKPFIGQIISWNQNIEY